MDGGRVLEVRADLHVFGGADGWIVVEVGTINVLGDEYLGFLCEGGGAEVGCQVNLLAALQHWVLGSNEQFSKPNSNRLEDRTSVMFSA